MVVAGTGGAVAVAVVVGDLASAHWESNAELSKIDQLVR